MDGQLVPNGSGLKKPEMGGGLMNEARAGICGLGRSRRRATKEAAADDR